MKLISIKFQTECTQAEDKFNKAIISLVNRFRVPASVRFTHEGATISAETNEMTAIKYRLRGQRIADRCMAFGNR